MEVAAIELSSMPTHVGKLRALPVVEEWRNQLPSPRARQHSRQHSLDLLLNHRLNTVVGQELAHVTARNVEQADETSSKLMSLKEEGGQILHDTSIPPDSPWSCRRSPPHCVKESFVMQTGKPAKLVGQQKIDTESA